MSPTNFENGNIVIYWGPNQNTEDFYVTPKASDWSTYSLLSIPFMGRFLYNSQGLDSDKYKPTVPPSPPPPPPGEAIWVFVDAYQLYGYGPDNPCKVWSTRWQLHDPSNPSFTPINTTICQTQGGPDGCACSPICQSQIPWNPRGYNPGTSSHQCPGGWELDTHVLGTVYRYQCNEREC